MLLVALVQMELMKDKVKIVLLVTIIVDLVLGVELITVLNV